MSIIVNSIIIYNKKRKKKWYGKIIIANIRNKKKKSQPTKFGKQTKFNYDKNQDKKKLKISKFH